MKTNLCIYSNRIIVNLFLNISTYYMLLLVKLSPKAIIMEIKVLGENSWSFYVYLKVTFVFS